MHKALGRNRRRAFVRRGGTGLSLQGGTPRGLTLAAQASCCETSAPSPWPAHRAAFFLPGWASLCPFKAADLTSCSGARDCPRARRSAFRFFSLRCQSSQRQLSTLGIPHRDLAGPPAGWPTRPNLGAVPGLGLGHTRDSVRMGECAQVGWHPPGSLPRLWGPCPAVTGL